MPRRQSSALGLALAALLVLLLASATLGQEPVISARIAGIADGDTVKALAAGNQLLRVRLSWIDAPESKQAFGPAVQATLERARIGAQGRTA